MTLEERFWAWWLERLRVEYVDGLYQAYAGRQMDPAHVREGVRRNLRHWSESWARYLRLGSGSGALHSKTPKPAPDGFVRLSYQNWSSPIQQGPNFFYIRPETVRSVERGYVVFSSGSRMLGGEGYAHIQPESAESLLQSAGVRPMQGVLL